MIDKLISMDKNLRITLLFTLMVLSVIAMPFVGWLWFIPFILVFVFLGLLIYSNGLHDRLQGKVLEKSMEKALIDSDFHADDSYLSDDYLSGIAINESHSKIAILKRKNTKENFILTEFKFNEIVECSIKEDGETLTKTSKGMAIGGTILAGVGGGILGGVLGSKHSSEQIITATLSIVIDDIKNPIHDIDFLNSKMLVNKNSTLYQNIYREMNKWYRRIGVILNRNEQVNKESM